MQNEERKKNIKVKEVITTLCTLLSALDVDLVPPAEVFRRAKFNKPDAAEELWRLLCSLLNKGFESDCACAELRSISDPQLCFVKSALWHSGYCGWWVVGPQACESREEIGSRDLLLAFSWLIASGNLIEALLRDRLLLLDVLASPAGVCSCMSSSPNPNTSHVPNLTGSTPLEKDLERIQTLNRILEAYLEWKNVEPLYWCWMDSVIDCYLSDGHQECSVDVLPRDQAVTQCRCHDNKARESVRRLDKMLLRLQSKHKDRLDRRTDTARLSPSQKEEVERRVATHLQGFSLVNTLTAIDKGFTPYYLESQASRSTSKPQRGNSGQGKTPGMLQASSVIKELRHRKEILEWEMELLRQSRREEMQSKANTLEGLVFILPLNR
ncbi:hypothetical protein C0J45_7428 [Silurus meridionalis]|nr:hypothetical protein C0J45_7428 [Silurus meridionalis]